MRQKGVASIQERRIVGGAVSPAPLSGVKPPGPSQERDQKEGKQLRPVRVNLTSGDESGGARRQIIRARAHSDAGKKVLKLVH
ncbi:hypothetical protein T03_342 [Trichinella britovi]|uniref:Uncharacterized protein n=1 Tax=Trichinella britovi TaxID=45882 RepID=A0A0V1CCD2_TRIBR|nr:hypothetical protein T03_342 [Trichinella britovi]